jgi:hypothetical protein
MKMHPTYEKISSEVGARRDTIQFILAFPDDACSRIEKRIKKFARVLEQNLGIPHSASLKTFAIGLRFENWHSMSAHLKSHGDVADEWLNTLKWSFFMLESEFDFFRLSEKMIDSVNSFAFRVADHTGSSIEVILDKVCAQIFNCSSWVDVLARDPLNVYDQYFYVHHEFGQLDFIRSPICQSLYDELGALEDIEDLDADDSNSERDPEKYSSAKVEWALRVIEKHPDFYPATAIIVYKMIENENFYGAKILAATWIKIIERDFPKSTSFKVFNFASNSFYYEILDGLIKGSFFSEDYKKALASARKSVRLSGDKDGGDSYGHRYIIPMALIMAHDYDKACATSTFKDSGSGLAYLIHAFACFAAGKHKEFITNICMVLFNEPGYKLFLLNDHGVKIPSDWRSHEHENDLYNYGDYLWVVYNELPDLRSKCERICNDSLFKELEKSLNQDYALLDKTKDPNERGRILDLIDKKMLNFSDSFCVSHKFYN